MQPCRHRFCEARPQAAGWQRSSGGGGRTAAAASGGGGGWPLEGTEFGEEQDEAPHQSEAQQEARLRVQYERGHCYGCGVRLQLQDDEVRVGARCLPALLACLHACAVPLRCCPCCLVAPVFCTCLASHADFMLALVTVYHPLQVAGYVEADRYEVKRRHRQLGQLLCLRCQSLSNGAMIPAVADFAQRGEQQQQAQQAQGQGRAKFAHPEMDSVGGSIRADNSSFTVHRGGGALTGVELEMAVARQQEQQEEAARQLGRPTGFTDKLLLTPEELREKLK
jgi:hypothetical protein